MYLISGSILTGVALMKVLLEPRPDRSINAQDLMISELVGRSGIVKHIARNGRYDISAIDPSLVITHNPDSNLDLTYISYFSAQNTPIVTHIHCQRDFYDEKRIENIASVLKLSDLLVVPHRLLVEQFLDLIPSRLPVMEISNGARRDIYYPAETSECREFRKEYRIDDASLVVGHVGHLKDMKGLAILRELVKNEVGTACTFFVQYPFWNADVREANAEAVISLERSARNPVVAYPDQGPRFDNRPMRYFDVLLSLSYSEVQPLTVLEGLACGLPLVTTASTPFFKDFEQNEVLRLNCRIVDFFGKDAQEIGREIANNLCEIERPDEMYRNLVSTTALELGYDLSDTYEKFVEAYTAVEGGDISSLCAAASSNMIQSESMIS